MEKNAEKTGGKKREATGKPFVKGDPRINKKGRPKGVRNFTTVYQEALKKIAESSGIEEAQVEYDLVIKAIAEAKKGKYQYHKDIFDRVYGSATQSLDLTTKGDKIGGLTPEEQEKLDKLLNEEGNK